MSKTSSGAGKSRPPESAALSPPWTLLKVLNWTTSYFESKGIESPRLEAELLLGHQLGLQRVHLYTQFDRPLVADELDAFKALIKRRIEREPTAYITGSRGFWTLDFLTDRRALIPRPDTEVLIEEALDRLADDDAHRRVIDVGTGTGVIALTLANERPHLHVLGLDISSNALELAHENVQALGLDERVELRESDLFSSVPPTWTLVEMVVSNPPYIAEPERDSLQPEVRDYEPGQALFAGTDGLDIIRRLVPRAFEHLKPKGWFLCEIGYDQGQAVQSLFEQHHFKDITVRKDYGQVDRVVCGRKPDE